MTAPGPPVVLVVDDTPAEADILADTLADAYDVLTASSGPAALELAMDRVPDLILLDAAMPGMDGYEVCRRLKLSPRTRSIPVIFVTALNQEEEETRGLSAGAIDYITKPIRTHIVLARVRNHLELKRYQDHLEALSTTDALTGIGNRRRLDEALDREWRRAMRNSSPLALILLDIDQFKQFNDRYGHLAGDDCLRQLTGALAACSMRPADVVARCGGEEFVCLLPDTDEAGAAVVAARIQSRVAQLVIPHASSSVSSQVTLSIGVAAMVPARDQAPTVLLQRSDEMLYEAKRTGRNRVAVWPGKEARP